MCDWVNLLYRRKLTEHYKPAIMEKNKKHYEKKKEKGKTSSAKIRKKIKRYQELGKDSPF